MIAAVYARKSTEQGGADEAKSVTRQIEHSRAYAARKGWTVADEHVYVDDGISGAEFLKRPGFLRLMNALKPRPAFQVLVMSEESRLGREAIETAYALKQLITAGVRVFFYLEDRERTLDSPTDKIMLSLTAFADELEREKGRQRTYDAMLRRAQAGYVTGGKLFGYDNVEVLGPDGTRSHVERRINEREAAIIRQIFELCVAGNGYSRIAKALNAEGAPAPRPQRARPAGWGPSSVSEVLHRETYHGVVVWNRSRKRDRWGQHRQAPRPEADWLRRSVPAMQIVSDDLWNAAQARLSTIRQHLQTVSRGRVGRRTRDVESSYLLPGFARCAVCGGGLGVVNRSVRGQRRFVYCCITNHKRGASICTNNRGVVMENVDRALLGKLASDVLRPQVIDAVVAGVLTALQPKSRATEAAGYRRDLLAIERELGRLTEAIAAGGSLSALLAGVQARHQRRDELAALIASAESATGFRALDTRLVERQVRNKLEDWQHLLSGHVQDARTWLRRALRGPVRFRPDDGSGFDFEGRAGLDELFVGTAINVLPET